MMVAVKRGRRFNRIDDRRLLRGGLVMLVLLVAGRHSPTAKRPGRDGRRSCHPRLSTEPVQNSTSPGGGGMLILANPGNSDSGGMSVAGRSYLGIDHDGELADHAVVVSQVSRGCESELMSAARSVNVMTSGDNYVRRIAGVRDFRGMAAMDAGVTRMRRRGNLTVNPGGQGSPGRFIRPWAYASFPGPEHPLHKRLTRQLHTSMCERSCSKDRAAAP